MELGLFDEVAEAVRGLVPEALGPPRVRVHRYGAKVWFGPDKPTREHYEAQVVGARHVPGASVLALEIGFHAEHPSQQDNDAVITVLTAAEALWRPDLGPEAEVAPFLGRPDDWRRVSETWLDPDLDEPDLGIEVGARLTDYIAAIEPILRRSGDT